MRYWSSPVGGIYPQRVEIFFTDLEGTRNGNVLLIFQNMKSRFYKQVGAVFAQKSENSSLLLRDLRDKSRQIHNNYDPLT